MKTIQEIISEQKSFIDLNISKYDLEYTINQFENNEYYLQEGLGESIQNAGRKVIEFIKKVIQKIKEMIKAVINMFRKNADPIKKLEAKIDMANKVLKVLPDEGGGGGSSSNGGKSPQEQMDEIHKKNQEKREQEIKDMEKKRREKEEEYEKRREEFVKNSDQPFKTGAGVKINSLKEILKNSLYKFSYYEMRGSIQKRFDFVQDFTSVFTKTYEHSDLVLSRHPDRIMKTESSYLVNKMNSGLFGEDDVDVNEALADILDDLGVPNGSGARQAHVYSYADHIYDYIHKGRDFGDIVNKLGNTTENIFKKIIGSLEKQERLDGMNKDLSDKHFSKLSIIFQKFSNYTAKVINYLITTTMSEYRSCVEIAQTVTSQYCKMMNV